MSDSVAESSSAFYDLLNRPVHRHRANRHRTGGEDLAAIGSRDDSSTMLSNPQPVSPGGPSVGVGASVAVKGGLAVALITLARMMATESRLPIVWDEGFTLLRLERVHAWLSAVRGPARFADGWRGTRWATTIEDRARRPLASEIDTRAELFSRQI